ncbi:hypothetical protein PPL_08429 [Heterostelium album PN500]|uniref:Calcineurin-like phosphoesterase domain-containing protein n=1 Tax=Heterostelium pallidum (strain ATCC 26659 / Pp 5 / PN500) TaxID=670386 RepID=D3BI61_HETP5|nr:hypothetical protein PPL_08429 [Heterostelium album PN500]EFA78961.1 hypothetical protein PPL_08429 [Heterostelium album PN500]|eukprot:XP_020431085.1 hypothetical protein PPL_08429 [Heterostelium album PN500]
MIRVLRYSSDIHLEMSQDIETLPHVAALYNFTPLENHRGNHEYYNIQSTHGSNKPKTIDEINIELDKLCAQFKNVHFLNNKTFQLDEFKIIGSTLWSHVPESSRQAVARGLNDYRLIGVSDPITNERRPASVADTNQLHKRAVQFIERELQNATNCILLTHHAPLYSMPRENKYLCSPHYLDSDINSAFHTDLNFLVKPPVLLWIYGHTHYTSKFIHNGVVIASNQVGYDKSPFHYQVNEEIVLGYAKI